MFRAALLSVCLITLAACQSQSMPYAPRMAAPVQPDRETTPMETAELFPRAIEEVCFAALARDAAPIAVAEEVGYDRAPAADPRYRTMRSDDLYAASFASSPVLLSLAPGERRCDVVAITGDHDALKLSAERVMEAFDQLEIEDKPDHIAFIEKAPHKGFAIRFSLLYGPDEIAEVTGLEEADDDIGEPGEDEIYVY